MFAVWAFDDEAYQPNLQPDLVFQDPTNTQTGGNLNGPLENTSGQIQGQSTRRDSHGSTEVYANSGNYVHVVDRIQSNVEVFDSVTYDRSTYDLISFSGKNGRVGRPGACADYSVPDFSVQNDPTADLSATTPDQKYIMYAFRGPAPVTFSHSGQGSCPGIGVVKLSPSGKSGKLVTVIPTTNKIPDSLPGGGVVHPPGGVLYTGKERSDVHGVAIVIKN
jgi:hypothetical protein